MVSEVFYHEWRVFEWEWDKAMILKDNNQNARTSNNLHKLISPEQADYMGRLAQNIHKENSNASEKFCEY